MPKKEQVGLFPENDSDFDKKSIRRNYQLVLGTTARLLSFATSLPIEVEGDVSEQQLILAVDDLVAFSLHARRLITEIGFLDLARNIHVPTIKPTGESDRVFFIRDGQNVSAYRLLNVMIHHHKIEIFRDSLDVLSFFSPRRLTYAEIISHDHERLTPKVIVKSDKSKPYFVDLQEYLLIFIERILNPIVNYCAEKHLFLEIEYIAD